MFALDQETLVMILSEYEGVPLISYGRPRDGFMLTSTIPHWTSGFGSRYEITHSNVPAGTMIAVGDLENLDIDNFDNLKTQLQKIDIYPTGHSGDFTGKDTDELKQWFFDRSVQDDATNGQTPIAHAQRLTREGLGPQRYEALINYLADEMNLFKDPKNGNTLVPADRNQRIDIATSILDGLSKTVRYTRLDGPATGYQLQCELEVTSPDAGTLSFLLQDIHKIIVLRKDPTTNKISVTPLDISMIGQTYVTADGAPLGNRGMVELSYIIQRAQEIEATQGPNSKPAPDYLHTILTKGPGKNVGASPAP